MYILKKPAAFLVIGLLPDIGSSGIDMLYIQHRHTADCHTSCRQYLENNFLPASGNQIKHKYDRKNNYRISQLLFPAEIHAFFVLQSGC